MVLADLPEDAEFTVKTVLLGREVGKRLADMGFTEGAEGRIVRRGFLRGPMQVLIRGYSILIRRCEAAGIAVESSAEPLPHRFPNGRGLGRGFGRGRGAGHGRMGAGPGRNGAGRGMRRGDEGAFR